MCCTRLAANAGPKKVAKNRHLGTIAQVCRAISSLVWGTPGNFNGFRVLAALLHGTLVVGVSQTLRRWTEGTTYIRQGGHHVGHWPTFLVGFILLQQFVISSVPRCGHTIIEHNDAAGCYVRQSCQWVTFYDPRPDWPITELTHDPCDPWPIWPITELTHDPRDPWPMTHDL